MDWTNEQKQAIYEKENNILVAAAAGSGKTAVLVERIINKVINDNIDIDKLLVVTFTNAAASEMRERILDAIYKKLEENPDSVNLQRQITLLNKASISTIHSFCLDVIRNNFYEIDISANFRIGDTAEIEMLKNDVLEDIFEKKYMDYDESFLKLINTYTDYRGDEKLQNLILSIYKYIQSNPYPEKWLNEKVDSFNVDSNCDFADTVWGKVLLENIKNELESIIIKLENIKKDTLRFTELDKYSKVLQEDINNLQSVKLNSWDEAYESINSVVWTKWPSDKKVTLELKDVAKTVRDNAKKEFAKIAIKYKSKEANEDIISMYEILDGLRKIVLEFSEEFTAKKREKNIIDFNDIEHLALKILVNENGEPTEVAKKYRQKFEEISIDEYQDSNLVQEKILTSISRGNNIFMVGDIKQSIYKFRQARPELFTEKYSTYALKSDLNPNSKGLKIQLFKNFRSRQNVLDITNMVFENIMSKKLGNVDYNETEYLNYGANYPEPTQKTQYAGIAELHIIDLKEQEEDYFTADASSNATNENAIKSNKLSESEDFLTNSKFQTMQKDLKVSQAEKVTEVNNIKKSGFEKININEEADSEIDEAEESDERIEDVVLEAKFVANKIKELLNSDYQVYDKKVGYRKIKPKDIAVLLRATSALAPIYEKEISEMGFPVFSDSSSTYLESMEVQTIMSLLKVIDNPMQDIPLITVLRSTIFNFTDNDLMKIRLVERSGPFYEAMLKARISVDAELRHKIDNTIEQLKKWKAEEKYTALDELIWKIYLDTGFYNYVTLLPNGNLRQANLKMLFEKAKQYEKASFKGLFNFINFIDKVKTSSGDLSAAKIIGENDDVIRIMSIHKSKGLEFPVVFLSSTGKKFNMQDLNSPILLDQDIGIGPQFIDSEKKIEYSTLAKEAIKIKSRIETISEEMRVLYVALTRAKEKLIITGMSKDLEKALKDKAQIIEMYKTNGENQLCIEQAQSQEQTQQKNAKNSSKINLNIVKKYISYLDWLELVYEFNKNNNIEEVVKLYTYQKENLLKDFRIEQNEEKNVIDEIQKKANEAENIVAEQTKKEIMDKLKWKYAFAQSSKIPTKTSVTKLKELDAENDIDDLIESAKNKRNSQTKLTITPKFLEKVQKLNAAQKGTVIHLCVQKLDESKEYSLEDIKEFIDNLKERHIISEVEADSVNTNLLYRYTKSVLWQEIKQAKEVHKEQPFYVNIPAKKIYDEAEENEMILVQGIIDLYFIDKEGKLVLVDYKTDYVENGNVAKLEEKYKVQLDLYKEALEKTLNRKVDRAMIWALNYNNRNNMSKNVEKLLL